MRLRDTAGVAVAAGAAAALLSPTTSSAATIGTTASCVFADVPAAVVGQGYAPGAPYVVQFGTNGPEPVTADAAGALSLPALVAPFGLRDPKRHAYERFPLVARDATGATVASASVLVAQKNAFLTPSVADISRTRRLVVAGLQPGVPAYVHVALQRNDGSFRQRRTRRLGTPTGECGRLDVRTRFLKGLSPLPRTGVAQISIDSQRAPSTATRPQARITISLRRRGGRTQPNYFTQSIAQGFFDVGVSG